MSVSSWRSVEPESEQLWFAVIDRLRDGPVREVCPSCSQAALRLFFLPGEDARGMVTHGGLWIWCPVCRRHMHMTSDVPPWWEPEVGVSDDLLEPVPTWLEEHWSELRISQLIT